MTNNTLTIFNDAKVELGKNYLTVNQPLTDTEYKTYFHELLKYNEATNFWIGDLLVEMEATKGSKVILDFANMIDVNEHSIESMRSFSRSIPKDKRVDGVSWSHHRDAYLECGKNIDVAKFWLDLSKKNSWSVREQRVKIREGISSKDNAKDRTQPNLHGDDVLYLKAITGIDDVKRFVNNINAKTSDSHVQDVIDAWTAVSSLIEDLK